MDRQIQWRALIPRLILPLQIPAEHGVAAADATIHNALSQIFGIEKVFACSFFLVSPVMRPSTNGSPQIPHGFAPERRAGGWLGGQ